jgi:cell division inhibitor SepF
VRQSSYPEPAPPRAAVATVRPIARDDGREPSTPVARAAVVRPFVTQRHTKPQVVAPARFSDAQEIGDMVKASSPVIVNLQASEKDLARRMIDFCSGLTYAVGGSMEKVAESVFLLTPSNVEVSPEERQRLQENGLFRS